MSLPNTSRFDLSTPDFISNHDNAKSPRVTSCQGNMTSSPRHQGVTREAVKLYCDDQSFKYIHITEETTAQELVHIGMDQVLYLAHLKKVDSDPVIIPYKVL